MKTACKRFAQFFVGILYPNTRWDGCAGGSGLAESFSSLAAILLDLIDHDVESGDLTGMGTPTTRCALGNEGAVP